MCTASGWLLKKAENSLAANEFWSTPLDLVPEFRGTDGLIVCRGPQALSQLCKLWGRQIAEIRPPSQLGRELTRFKICKNNSSYLRWEQCLTCSCCWGLWCGRFSDSNLSALKCYSDTGGWSSWSTANHIKQRGPVIIKVKTKQSYLHLKDKTWHLQCYPGSSNPPGPEDSCSAHRKKEKRDVNIKDLHDSKCVFQMTEQLIGGTATFIHKHLVVRRTVNQWKSDHAQQKWNRMEYAKL